MRGNHLVFSRSGDRRKLYGVSPYLFPQYTDFNAAFLPDDRELPLHGLQAQCLVFDFGFALPANTIAPLDTQFFPITIPNDFLALSISGAADVPPSAGVVPSAGLLAGVNVRPTYLINFQQTHGGSTWQWKSKDVTDVEAVGTGENPHMFKSPVFLPKGDTLSCVLRNLGNTSLRVQILLSGGSF
ncbi:MAG TPA: hypothetical protein VJX72_10710 [Candidatus Acidoferrum sp.]|nr:hypothetical protein [Candidatus Acidoferrum sp.]